MLSALYHAPHIDFILQHEMHISPRPEMAAFKFSVTLRVMLAEAGVFLRGGQDALFVQRSCNAPCHNPCRAHFKHLADNRGGFLVDNQLVLIVRMPQGSSAPRYSPRLVLVWSVDLIFVKISLTYISLKMCLNSVISMLLVGSACQRHRSGQCSVHDAQGNKSRCTART